MYAPYFIVTIANLPGLPVTGNFWECLILNLHSLLRRVGPSTILPSCPPLSFNPPGLSMEDLETSEYLNSLHLSVRKSDTEFDIC